MTVYIYGKEYFIEKSEYNEYKSQVAKNRKPQTVVEEVLERDE